jgi:hypothetical protein
MEKLERLLGMRAGLGNNVGGGISNADVGSGGGDHGGDRDNSGGAGRDDNE